jgi:hypothetical protein
MGGGCQFSLGGLSGAAEWSFDGAYLTVTPEGGSPSSYPVQEMMGVAGDGYTLRVAVPAGEAQGAELLLSHLGADGPTLLEALRRYWLTARVEVLRLVGTGEGRPLSGRVAGLDGEAADSFRGTLFQDLFLIAREGRDFTPIFLALTEGVTFDQPAYTVKVREWPGRELVFSRLAGETQELLSRLRVNRGLLAEESAGVLAAAVPTLPAVRRSVLAGIWMPGRLLDLEKMNTLCPGFEEAFRRDWLPRLLRHDEGEHLLGWASSGSSWLGCTRESAAEGGGGDAAERPLWMLCGKDGVWFLEALSIEDRATYCFSGGEEVPALASRLLCAPQFSKEALYSPLKELTGASADLATPAQFLGFLVELRARFRERVIHQTPEGWRKEIDTLGKAG